MGAFRKFALLAAVALGAVGAAQAAPEKAAPDAELRFCPAGQVWAYPLDETGRSHSLLLQNLTVVNQGKTPLRVTALHIDLLANGTVVETRTLDRAQVERWGSNAEGVQALVDQAPWQVCGEALVPSGVRLGGPVLKTGQALLIFRQQFAMDGPRDTLRVRVEAERNGTPVQLAASMPVRTGFSKTQFRFPMNGVAYVGWAPSMHSGHRFMPAQEFALDIARTGPGGLTYSGDGQKFADYFAYGDDILAAADGRVVLAVDGEPEFEEVMQRPGESAEDYAKRHRIGQAQRAARGLNGVAGNHVMLDHGNGEYSFYAHMKPGSVKVKAGDVVKAGQVLGELGSSGNSTEPHLHFHVCDGPDPLNCAGIPVLFQDVSILWANGMRALQSGDIVTVKKGRT